MAGIVSTLITAPLDMIKTRLMMQRESKTAAGYKNGFHCAYQVLHIFYHETCSNILSHKKLLASFYSLKICLFVFMYGCAHLMSQVTQIWI